jgi:thiosulfate reductase cytochrome b subunit
MFLFFILILTGLSMQYSNPTYPLIRFDLAVSIHNVAGILLVIGFAWYLISNGFTGNYKYYKINWTGMGGRLMAQFRYYIQGLFKGEKAPFPITKERKFNPLQKFAYWVVMYFFMPVMIISGIALMYPEMIIPNVLGVSGVFLTALVHTISGFLLTVFMLIHVYFSTMGKTPTSNFKSMITGWHDS